MTSLRTKPTRLQQVVLLLHLFTVATVGVAIAGGGTFDHSAFNTLLSQAVSGGKVDYGKFKGNAAFAAYLSALQAAEPMGLTSNEQLAFWINAYNASTIKNVLDNPGMRKPTDVKGFFDAKKFKIAGRSLTLNQIENDIIRKNFKEPLIHFGLVCAARSCPPIINKAYTGKNVKSLLASNAKAYLAGKQNSYNAATNTLSLSKIFEWYREDFGGESGLKEFVKKYGTAEMKAGLTANPKTKIVSLEYDWTLNSK
ncbi:MAG: DUF547 domain-containing protein [Chlorobi bacterium CHB2]|nr:DUF547 domain-containing protein [Chlorobi bacterium CHB2]